MCAIEAFPCIIFNFLVCLKEFQKVPKLQKPMSLRMNINVFVINVKTKIIRGEQHLLLLVEDFATSLISR